MLSLDTQPPSPLANMNYSIYYYFLINLLLCYQGSPSVYRHAETGVGGFEEACGHMRPPCREHSRHNSTVGTKSVVADDP